MIVQSKNLLSNSISYRSIWKFPVCVLLQYGAPAVPSQGTNSVAQFVAPLSGGSVGLARAHVSHGVREVSNKSNWRPFIFKSDLIPLIVGFYFLSTTRSVCANRPKERSDWKPGLSTTASSFNSSRRTRLPLSLACASAIRFCRLTARTSLVTPWTRCTKYSRTAPPTGSVLPFVTGTSHFFEPLDVLISLSNDDMKKSDCGSSLSS